MQPLVTIVIPVYNVEKYVEKCVESVQKQDYKNIEIILVDDGSNDKSGAICDLLEQSDKRIRVIHQENKGLSVARNVGIDESNGEWIYFLDSDDWIAGDLLSKLINVALSTKSDIACCTSKDVYEDGTIANETIDTNEIRILKREEIIESLLQKDFNVRFEVWNKLWKRELIGDTRFIAKQVSEDIHFDRILFLKTNQIAYLNSSLHYYRIQRPGNTNSSFKVKRLCVFQEFAEWIEDLRILKCNASIRIVSYIACNTAAGLYYEAQKSGQEKSVLNQLVEEFLIFYEGIKNSSFDISKLKLFRACPYAYCIVSRIYKMFQEKVRK